MINIRLFSHFIAVLESGSFLGASKKMNISQPALSKSIISIENYYKVPLFKRLPRGVQPSAFALALEPHARRILLDVTESKSEIAAMAAGSSGKIAIGAGSSFVRVVTETMRDLVLDVPDVQFSLLTDHANHLRQALLGNRIDFYVGMANNEFEDQAFTVDTLFTDRFSGLCAPDHVLCDKTISPNQLAQYEWIVPSLEEPARAALDAYFISHNQMPPKVKITTNSEAVMNSFLTGTEYLSVTPLINLKLPAFRELGHFDLKGFDFERKVGIVQRTNSLSSPLIEKFIALLKLRMSQMQPVPPEHAA